MHRAPTIAHLLAPRREEVTGDRLSEDVISADHRSRVTGNCISGNRAQITK